MKIKVKRNFYDRKLEKVVKEGATYEVTPERGKELIGKGFVEEVKGTKNGKR